MALKDVIKVTRKTYFDPRRWLGYDNLKSQTIFVGQQFKQVFGPAFKPPSVQQAESFSDAVARFSLTEKDIAESMKIYLILTGIFFLAAIGALALFIKYLLGGHFAATCVSLGVASFMFSQAFKYHFWYFQLKHRKLGCTFEEWYRGTLSKGGDDHA